MQSQDDHIRSASAFLLASRGTWSLAIFLIANWLEITSFFRNQREGKSVAAGGRASPPKEEQVCFLRAILRTFVVVLLIFSHSTCFRRTSHLVYFFLFYFLFALYLQRVGASAAERCVADGDCAFHRARHPEGHSRCGREHARAGETQHRRNQLLCKYFFFSFLSILLLSGEW